MSQTKNSLLAARVFEALFAVVGRRTLNSFAIQILRTTLEKLKKRFDFLTSVTIDEDFFSHDGIQVRFSAEFDSIDSSRFSEAIDALIRVVYLELIQTIGVEVGLYFVTELKDYLGDMYFDELKEQGVHFERIQEEQHSQMQIKGFQNPLPYSKKQEEQELPKYTWDSVSTWKYENNVCVLYDEKGKLLDTLYLDLLIEEYVQRVTAVQTPPQLSTQRTTTMKVTEKETELLEMIHRRDTDVQSAISLLHISQQKFDMMIQKLLQLELLQYISDKEVKLTEKGLQHVTANQKK
jgi:hypothetical protein